MLLPRVRPALVLIAQISIVTACSTSDPAAVATGPTTVPVESPITKKADALGFVWSREAGLQVIEGPQGAEQLILTSMNSGGTAVGFFTSRIGQEDYRAFRWSPGTGVQKIGSLVGPDGIAIALAIDDANTITGISEGPTTVYNGPMGIFLNDRFVWDPEAGMRPADPLDPSAYRSVADGGKLALPTGADCIEISATSSSGYAVGYAGTLSGQCKLSVAVLWSVGGSPTKIGECGARPWCGISLKAVNNNGEAVGYRDGVGFRWSATRGFENVPLDHSAAYVINDKGDVGGAVGFGNQLQPFLWTAKGEIVGIALPEGFVYGYPVAINERGQIAGNAHWIRL